MIDPELEKYLSSFNQHLTELKAKKTPGIWQAFFNGMFAAFGYLVGVVMVVVLAGFILNKTGLLVPFQEQWQKFQTFMTTAENSLGGSQQNKGQGTGQKGEIYTLPNGQKVQVVQ